MSDGMESPISCPIDVRRLPERGFPVVVEPNAAARSALARAHGLVAVESFRGELLFKAWKRGGVAVTGRVRARIVQECVVTLEPVEAAIDEVIDTVFVPDGSPLARETIDDGELLLPAEGPDLPEPFDGATIDAGATAEEFFALGIDPYPRRPGAQLPAAGSAELDPSPFAVLREPSRKP
jgi:hypothetical protein